MSEVKKLKFYANGVWQESKTNKYMDVFNPSTGELIAKAPCCTEEEINIAVKSAKDAFATWSKTPVMKRVQVLYNFRELVKKNSDELTELVATENGKVWGEAMGDTMKIMECNEFACGMPTLMMGESLRDTSTGYDTVLYREPVGVFAGIPAWNFPGMIPMGWMAPICLAAGNTIVIKTTSSCPLTAMRYADLWKEAGLPDGVMNIVTCSRNEVDAILRHPDVKGVTFVGSTSVGRQIYEKAAASGKRVQALCEAKNHGLVLEDAALEEAAGRIMNSSFGCAGERCMALSVIVAQESIADRLIELLVEEAKKLKVGPASDRASKLGPLVTKAHKESVVKWIEKGVEEGAKLVLDGRNVKVEGFENGYYLGPTIFDHITPDMTIGDMEIFGPVMCIKRVKDFEEGLELMNKNQFANGSVIFTESGHYSREFASRTDGGMVGINVGVPVPTGIFPFTGHKDSFFGSLHVLGKDGVRFYTETKAVTTTWLSKGKGSKKIDTWEGSVGGNLLD